MGAEWGEQDGSVRDVALEVLVSGPISRTDLARRLGLSQSSLTRLTKPLLASGLIAEVDAGPDRPRRAGRPSQPLAVVPSARRFVGVKVTGATVHGVLVDLACAELARRDEPLADTDPAAVVDAIARTAAALAGDEGIAALGISISGPVADGRAVADSPFLGWRERVELADLVEAATGAPVAVSNDISALVRAEQWFGAGRDAENVAVVTIGAGVGFGLIAGGQIVESADAGIGHVGHIPLDDSGPLCAAGHRGCAMAMLTTDAICAQVSPALGRAVGYDEVLRLAGEGDPAASAVVGAAGRALGRLVALAANFTFARTIVVSGEGDELLGVARDAFDAELAARRDPRADPVEVVVRPADFIEWARGAAAVAIRAHVLG